MRRRSDLQYDDPRFPSPSDLNPTIVYSVSAAEWSARRASV
jgi:hypothetical protein